MKTSSNNAFKNNAPVLNSNFVVPSSSVNKEAAKNASWNLGWTPVNYVSTNKDLYRPTTAGAPPSKQE